MSDVPPATFLTDFLEHRATERPDKACWIYGDRSWTWAEAWDSVRRAAGGMRAEGIGRGDRIAFLDKNNPAILQLTLGGCLVGSANAIINWRLAGDELDYAINDSGARVVFVGHELAGSLALIRDKLGSVRRSSSSAARTTSSRRGSMRPTRSTATRPSRRTTCAS